MKGLTFFICTLLLSLGLSSCMVDTKHTLIYFPSIVVDKKKSESDLYYEQTKYYLKLYSDSLNETNWYTVSEYIYNKYDRLDTLQGEVIVIIKTIK